MQQNRKVQADVEAIQTMNWTRLCQDIDERCRPVWHSIFSRWLLYRYVNHFGPKAFEPEEGWYQTKKLKRDVVPGELHFQTWSDAFSISLAEIGAVTLKSGVPRIEDPDRKTSIFLNRLIAASELPGFDWLGNLFGFDRANGAGIEALKKSLDRGRGHLRESGFARIVILLYPYRVSLCAPAHEIDDDVLRTMADETVPWINSRNGREEPGRGFYFEVSLDQRIDAYRKSTGIKKRGRPQSNVASPSGKYLHSGPFYAPSNSQLLDWIDRILPSN